MKNIKEKDDRIQDLVKRVSDKMDTCEYNIRERNNIIKNFLDQINMRNEIIRGYYCMKIIKE